MRSILHSIRFCEEQSNTMRITNSMIQTNATLSLQSNLQAMTTAQNQVSTGLKYSSFADDPQAQSSVMQTSTALNALNQYQRNVNDATARANMEDTVLQQLTDTVTRATAIATQQGTATSSASDRLAAKQEVDNLLSSAVSAGNTQYQGTYLFGGDNTTTAPVTTTPPFYTGTPPSGTHTTEIASGQLFKSNHNAKELLLDTGTLQSLKDLSTALGNNDQVGIGAALTSLNNSQQGIQSLVGDLGARENQLQVTSSNITALQQNLTNFRTNLSNVDQEQAITDLVTRQTAYQSAMLATSRVLGMTLTDYLK
jgi:flagellar hook-associated protein 3 FlgL